MIFKVLFWEFIYSSNRLVISKDYYSFAAKLRLTFSETNNMKLHTKKGEKS